MPHGEVLLVEHVEHGVGEDVDLLVGVRGPVVHELHDAVGELPGPGQRHVVVLAGLEDGVEGHHVAGADPHQPRARVLAQLHGLPVGGVPGARAHVPGVRLQEPADGLPELGGRGPVGGAVGGVAGEASRLGVAVLAAAQVRGVAAVVSVVAVISVVIVVVGLSPLAPALLRDVVVVLIVRLEHGVVHGLGLAVLVRLLAGAGLPEVGGAESVGVVFVVAAAPHVVRHLGLGPGHEPVHPGHRRRGDVGGLGHLLPVEHLACNINIIRNRQRNKQLDISNIYAISIKISIFTSSYLQASSPSIRAARGRACSGPPPWRGRARPPCC